MESKVSSFQKSQGTHTDPAILFWDFNLQVYSHRDKDVHCSLLICLLKKIGKNQQEPVNCLTIPHIMEYYAVVKKEVAFYPYGTITKTYLLKEKNKT